MSNKLSVHTTFPDAPYAVPYAVEVVPEECTDGSFCYRASHPELPGCMSHGLTPEEAIKNLSEAKLLYIQALLGQNQPIPKPRLAMETGTSILNQQEARIWEIWDFPTRVAEASDEKKTSVGAVGSLGAWPREAVAISLARSGKPEKS